jgi:hypothetical protein
MQAKVSSLGMRFFAHDREAGCPSAGESAEHRALKLTIIRAARSLGYEAMPEVAGEGWRTDVLVTSPMGRRVAFEVQLAGMTADEGSERTERIKRDGVDEVVWLSTRFAPWLGAIPSIWLYTESDVGYVVGVGTVQWSRHWAVSTPSPSLVSFIADVMFGSAVSFRPPRLYVDVPRNGGFRYVSLDVAWASPAAIVAWERAAAERAADERRHAAAFAALWDRQKRLVPAAVELAQNETGEQVWVGWPPGPPGKPFFQDERSGFGVTIWVGRPRQLRVWGVVCPVAGRIERAVWYRLKEARVFAETPEEQQRINLQLNRTRMNRAVEILSGPPAPAPPSSSTP